MLSDGCVDGGGGVMLPTELALELLLLLEFELKLEEEEASGVCGGVSKQGGIMLE